MKTVRIGCAGEWHSHGKDFARRLADDPRCIVTTIWSDCLKTGQEWAQAQGCRFEPDYDAFLDDVDAVILISSTASHREMICRAANKGKHVFVEKALTVSDEDAEAIRDAVHSGGIHFTMSDPVMKAPVVWAKQCIEKNWLGQIKEVRAKMVHDSALSGDAIAQFFQVTESGGGVMIDMGCKAVHTLHYLLGMPESVRAEMSYQTQRSKDTGAEDNALAVYRFPGGITGIAECSWTTPRNQMAVELYGTNGTISIVDWVAHYRFNGEDWNTMDPADLPPAAQHPLFYWMDSIVNDTPNTLYDIDQAVCLTKMITAAYRSCGNEIKIL